MPKTSNAEIEYTRSCWTSMHHRCKSVETHAAKYYAGCGIRICPEWQDFDQFMADMGVRPKGTSIDRIDPYGDYSPENCRWATDQQQGANKTNFRYEIILCGIALPIEQWESTFKLSQEFLKELTSENRYLILPALCKIKEKANLSWEQIGEIIEKLCEDKKSIYEFPKFNRLTYKRRREAMKAKAFRRAHLQKDINKVRTEADRITRRADKMQKKLDQENIDDPIIEF